MKVLVSYRAIPQSPGWATGDMVAKAFEELDCDVYRYAKKYEKDTWLEDPETLLRDRYDLVVFMECNDGDRQYAELKNISTRKAVTWTFDNSYYGDKLLGLINSLGFDHNFVANPLIQPDIPNSSYLPYACDPELHSRKYYDYHKCMDFCLPGSIRPDREQLKKEFRHSSLQLCLVSDTFREDYITILHQSSAIVNQNPTEGTGLLNMRFFEAPAAGALILTENRDLLANPISMIEPLHCYGYDDYVSLIDLCEYLSDNPDEIKNATLAGQEEVLLHHTYRNRCEKILEIL